MYFAKEKGEKRIGNHSSGMSLTCATKEVESRDLDCSFGKATKSPKTTGWSRIAFITLQGAPRAVGRGSRTSPPWVPDEGGPCPRERRRVSYPWSKLHYFSVHMQKEKVRSSHRTGSPSQKGLWRELPSISKTIHIPSKNVPRVFSLLALLLFPCPHPPYTHLL